MDQSFRNFLFSGALIAQLQRKNYFGFCVFDYPAKSIKYFELKALSPVPTCRSRSAMKYFILFGNVPFHRPRCYSSGKDNLLPRGGSVPLHRCRCDDREKDNLLSRGGGNTKICAANKHKSKALFCFIQNRALQFNL